MQIEIQQNELNKIVSTYLQEKLQIRNKLVVHVYRLDENIGPLEEVKKLVVYVEVPNRVVTK